MTRHNVCLCACYNCHRGAHCRGEFCKSAALREGDTPGPHINIERAMAEAKRAPKAVALGEKMTGLPIDFQVQSVTIGNSQAGPRWALGGRFEPRRSVRDRRTPVNDVDIIPPAQGGGHHD